MTKYLIIGIIILSIIILYFFFSNKRKTGFSGVYIEDLEQPKEFYTKNREKTLTYLLSVYPNAQDSLQKLSDLELASFYNSLTHYYNCQYSYSGDNGWDPLPCKDKYPLPYPPQGWFFNFYTYQKENIPYIYSDSDEEKEELKLENFGNGRPNIAFVTQDEKNRAGPGMFWLNSRTILRNCWYPNGLSFSQNKDRTLTWNYGKNQPIKWNFPKGWLEGFNDNTYVEVTHTEPVPSIVQSLGWWWNCVTGSGIFLNIGKTLKSKNKIDATFKLLSQCSKDFLKKWYNTDDVYEIIFGITGYCGYREETKQQFCDFRYVSCYYDWCDPDYFGVIQTSKLPLNNFYIEAVRYQKENNISQSDTITKQGIIAAVNAATNHDDYRLSRISTKVLLDEHLFFLGLNLGYDTIQMTYSTNSNGYYGFEIIDLRLPQQYLEKAKDRDYFDFVNVKVKENIPKSQSANSNTYKKEFIQQWLDKMIQNKTVSVRDPLDVLNEKKVSTCNISSIFQKICSNNLQYDGAWYNFYCSNVPITNEYKCLSLGEDADDKNNCILKGDNPTC
jgi:hypothetical protein